MVIKLKIGCLKKDTDHLNTHAIIAIRNITRMMKKNMKDINKSIKVKTEKGKMYKFNFKLGESVDIKIMTVILKID